MTAMIRFPMSTPMVSRSKALTGREVILIDGAQFEDDRRRIVVGREVTDATMTALTDALEQYERLDGMRRWFADLITDHMIRCDYCGDALPLVAHRSHLPTTPDLQRLGFAADKIVCPECVSRVRAEHLNGDKNA